MSELTPEVDLHNDTVTSESPTSNVDSGTSESPTSPPPKADLRNNSGTSESPTSPPPKLHNSDLGSDMVLWRRKQLNLSILVAATGVWVMMDAYEYNFITLLSWSAIALLSCLFFWGSIHSILKKEAPDLSGFEISEESAVEQAKVLRQRAEDGIRLVFHVGCEREWFVFAGVVLSLYLLSIVAKHLDFATLCFLGIVGAMSVSAVYVKYEKRIGEFADKVRMQSQRLKVMIEEKLQKMKNRVVGKPKVVKEEKTK